MRTIIASFILVKMTMLEINAIENQLTDLSKRLSDLWGYL